MEQIYKAQLLINKVCQIDKSSFSPRTRVKSYLHVSAYAIISICLSTTKCGCANKWYSLQIVRQKTYYIQSKCKRAKHSNFGFVDLEPFCQSLFKRTHNLLGFPVMSYCGSPAISLATILRCVSLYCHLSWIAQAGF